MRSKKLSIGLRAILAMFTVTLLVTTTCVATEKKLHNFNFNGRDGYDPFAGLTSDATGNLYGTTIQGGDYCCEGYGCGAVFELTPNGSGGWTEKKLHSFGKGKDGYSPRASVILDAAGNLYGTTQEGGDYFGGTVFELMPNGSGGWTEKKLHNFGHPRYDGYYPSGGLIFDGAGNLYGTTHEGGAYGGGTVFELTPNGSGGWTEKKLHNFGPWNGTDGNAPAADLIFDAAGNLYGTTSGGGDPTCGDSGCGTVFELTPNGSGGWTEKKLHTFGHGTDGAYPSGALIFDTAGNLYGTTYAGGDRSAGTVFELTPNGSGGWTEKKLHTFGRGTDGAYPGTTLIFDLAGNLYGTTEYGGSHQCGENYGCGTVFELTSREGGGWTEKKLHNFYNNSLDGTYPCAGLIIDAAGNLYGTTYGGGDYGGRGGGTVFEITP